MKNGNRIAHAILKEYVVVFNNFKKKMLSIQESAE